MGARAYFGMPAYRGARIRRVLVVSFGAALVSGLSALPAGAVSQGSSGLWSGLVSNGGGYTRVTADVTVPRVSTYCGTSSNVVAYVGLGGWSGVPFAQNGFTVTPKGLGLWWEVFDRTGAGPTAAVSLPIRPGDTIRLGLWFSADKSVLTFRWENLTVRKAVSRTVTNARRYYNGSTADYVVERSWYPYRGSPLARFSGITFRNAKAVRSGTWLAAYNSGSTRVTLVGDRGNQLARVTYATGTTFTTSWLGCR